MTATDLATREAPKAFGPHGPAGRHPLGPDGCFKTLDLWPGHGLTPRRPGRPKASPAPSPSR